MRRILLVCFALTVAVVGRSQTFRTMFSPAYERVTAEIVAGFNTSDLILEDIGRQAGAVANFKQHPGFNFGVNVDVPVFEGFYIKPGLSFTTRGGNYRKQLNDTDYFREVCSSYYLQMPIFASFRLGDIDTAQLQLNIGPYFSLGLFGDRTRSEKLGRVELTTEYDYFYTEYDGNLEDGFARRFDWGLSFVVGMLFVEHIYLGVQYDLGLYNIAKERRDVKYCNIYNGNLSVSVGYRF